MSGGGTDLHIGCLDRVLTVSGEVERDLVSLHKGTRV